MKRDIKGFMLQPVGPEALGWFPRKIKATYKCHFDVFMRKMFKIIKYSLKIIYKKYG